jgi:hypothetical protein
MRKAMDCVVGESIDLVVGWKFASTNHQSTNANHGELSFRELKPLASAFLTILFALFGARVACQQSGFLEFLAKFAVKLKQSTGDAVTHSASLSGRSPARNVHQHIELAECVGQLQRLADYHSLRFVLEMSIKRLAIDFEIAGSWS